MHTSETAVAIDEEQEREGGEANARGVDVDHAREGEEHRQAEEERAGVRVRRPQRHHRSP